jgi:hypothetical protein
MKLKCSCLFTFRLFWLLLNQMIFIAFSCISSKWKFAWFNMIKKKLEESEAKHFFLQLISALDYLHNDKQIVHRDWRSKILCWIKSTLTQALILAKVKYLIQECIVSHDMWVTRFNCTWNYLMVTWQHALRFLEARSILFETFLFRSESKFSFKIIFRKMIHLIMKFQQI